MILLDEIRARVEAATPGPWRWGDDWDEAEADAALDVFATQGGSKYLDLGLYGPDGHILGVGVDHYETIWDVGTDLSGGPTRGTREFIASAREDVLHLLELVGALNMVLTTNVGGHTPEERIESAALILRAVRRRREQ